MKVLLKNVYYMQIHMQWMHATCSDLVCMMTIRVQWEYFILFLILSVVLWNGYPRLMVFTVMTAMLVKIGSREPSSLQHETAIHTKSVYFSVFLSPQIVHTFQIVLNIACLMLHVSSFFFYNLLSLHLQFFCLYYLHVVINELLYISRHPKHLYRSNNRQIIYRIITKI